MLGSIFRRSRVKRNWNRSAQEVSRPCLASFVMRCFRCESHQSRRISLSSNVRPVRISLEFIQSGGRVDPAGSNPENRSRRRACLAGQTAATNPTLPEARRCPRFSLTSITPMSAKKSANSPGRLQACEIPPCDLSQRPRRTWPWECSATSQSLPTH